MLFHSRENQFHIPAAWVIWTVWFRLNKRLSGIQPVHCTQDQRYGAFRIVLIDMAMPIYIR